MLFISTPFHFNQISICFTKIKKGKTYKLTILRKS